jgi:hypothetical protein
MLGQRAKIQARIEREVEPALIELIRKHDGLMPGISLTGVAGVDDPPEK